MLDKLESFINGISDMDWYWWPILSLRPPKDRDIDDRQLLKLTLLSGSLVGVVFMLLMFLVAVEPLDLVDILLIIVFSLVFGWILFFVYSKFVFAYFWNRRARRLRAR